MNKIGKIDISKLTTPPLKEEFLTAKLLAKQLNCDVEFIPPIQRKGARTPDIKMQNLSWEIKNPRKNGSNTIENSLRNALRQSNNIIFDLRKLEKSQQNAINKLKNNFNTTKKLKNLIIITQTNKILRFQK